MIVGARAGRFISARPELSALLSKPQSDLGRARIHEIVALQDVGGRLVASAKKRTVVAAVARVVVFVGASLFRRLLLLQHVGSRLDEVLARENHVAGGGAASGGRVGRSTAECGQHIGSGGRVEKSRVRLGAHRVRRVLVVYCLVSGGADCRLDAVVGGRGPANLASKVGLDHIRVVRVEPFFFPAKSATALFFCCW